MHPPICRIRSTRLCLFVRCRLLAHHPFRLSIQRFSQLIFNGYRRIFGQVYGCVCQGHHDIIGLGVWSIQYVRIHLLLGVTRTRNSAELKWWSFGAFQAFVFFFSLTRWYRLRKIYHDSYWVAMAFIHIWHMSPLLSTARRLICMICLTPHPPLLPSPLIGGASSSSTNALALWLFSLCY